MADAVRNTLIESKINVLEQLKEHIEKEIALWQAIMLETEE